MKSIFLSAIMFSIVPIAYKVEWPEFSTMFSLALLGIVGVYMKSKTFQI